MKEYRQPIATRLAFTLSICLFYAQPAISASNGELEKEIKDLNNTVEELQTTLEKLETRVVKSNKKTKRKLRSLRETIKHKHTGLRVGGFASYGLTTSNADYDDATVTFRDEFIYRTDTMAALQVDYIINDQLSTTVQIVSEAITDFEAKIDWAYVTYNYNDNWRLQVGRQPQALSLYSLQLKAGISYPWARPPMGFYVTSLSGAEAISVTYQKQVGGWYHRADFNFAASEITPFPGFTFAASDGYQFIYQADYRAWTFRVFVGVADLKLNDQTDYGDTRTLSLRYDDGDWFFLAEGFNLRSGNVITGDLDRQFISIGKYLGARYMAYVTATNLAAYEEFQVGYDDIKAASHSAGLRYNIHPQVAIKGQWEHFYKQENSLFPSNSLSMVIDVAY